MVEDGDDEDGGLTVDDTSGFVRAITHDPNASTATCEARRESTHGGDRGGRGGRKGGRGRGGDARRHRERHRADRSDGVCPVPRAVFHRRPSRHLRRADLRLRDGRDALDIVWQQRAKARVGNRVQATREYENRVREQQEARQKLEAFKNYKPDVNIVYYDGFGCELTPKEAWKALSHKFHDKGSGSTETEKRLKRFAEERKKEAMADGDAPLSMNQAFEIRQEKTGQAHFVLSVGNRGCVPSLCNSLFGLQLIASLTEQSCSVGRRVLRQPAAYEGQDGQEEQEEAGGQGPDPAARLDRVHKPPRACDQQQVPGTFAAVHPHRVLASRALHPWLPRSRPRRRAHSSRRRGQRSSLGLGRSVRLQETRRAHLHPSRRSGRSS